ncbi:MAG: flagellar hook-basal body complex protein FliE [Gammaproteobacteria bacterium]|jgi:flagellar hook-basal body complex protein FliE|nr:flagellar hook-basal body complex protein FliE [Gammaproteobacteria bacterium]MCL5801980.1 flagellar hook-basal body complex protein FliE [Gammaproteobacteria bacterium]
MNDIDVSQLLNQLRSTAVLARGETAAASQTAEGGFADLLKRSIDGVNEAQQTASKLTQAFESGDKQADLAEVMVALQKASISFQAMTQVRNKLVSAYQDVMNMQV